MRQRFAPLARLLPTLALAAPACAAPGASPDPAASGAVMNTPATNALLVLNKAAASASLIDPATGQTIATMPTGEGPHEVAVSPDGARAIVSNYGATAPGSTLTVLDLAARRAVATIDLAPHRRPHGVAWLPDARHVVVTCETDSLLLIVDVESARLVGSVGTGQGTSHMTVVSRDGTRAYVANIGSGSVSMIDLAGRFLLRSTPTGAGAEGIALTPSGAELWVTNRVANTITVLDAETLVPRDTLRSADFPIRVAFTPDGARALVTHARSGELRIFDATTLDTLATIAMPLDSALARGTMLGMEFGRGTGVPIGVLVRPDGRVAYVANANADAITVVDLRALRVSGYLPTGREPDGLGWVR